MRDWVVFLGECSECDKEGVCVDFGVSLMASEGNCTTVSVCSECLKSSLESVGKHE